MQVERKKKRKCGFRFEGQVSPRSPRTHLLSGTQGRIGQVGSVRQVSNSAHRLLKCGAMQSESRASMAVDRGKQPRHFPLCPCTEVLTDLYGAVSLSKTITKLILSSGPQSHRTKFWWYKSRILCSVVPGLFGDELDN